MCYNLIENGTENHRSKIINRIWVLIYKKNSNIDITLQSLKAGVTEMEVKCTE